MIVSLSIITTVSEAAEVEQEHGETDYDESFPSNHVTSTIGK